MKMLERNRASGGFTLVELLAVVMIIAVLSAMIIGVAEFAKRSANEARAKGEIEKLKIAAQEYKMKHGSYPGVTADVPALIASVPDLTNFMVESVSYTDPWGNPYQYTKHSRHHGSFLSYGYDGTSGTEDDIRSGR